ncbi:MAG TPA: hypothetical protein VJI74_00225 [Candidatus Paceibacterota bacterium]
MLNVFPSLLILSFFAPLLLRAILAIWLFSETYHRLRHRPHNSFQVWCLIVSEGIAGVLLMVGAWTQIGALLSLGVAIELLYLHRKKNALAQESPWLYIFVAAISLSLLATGAGALAIDMPL